MWTCDTLFVNVYVIQLCDKKSADAFIGPSYVLQDVCGYLQLTTMLYNLQTGQRIHPNPWDNIFYSWQAKAS